MKILKGYLMTPIFPLYRVSKIEEIKFDKILSERMKDYDELKHRIGIYEALKWAENNPNFHFESIMEEAPVRGRLKFTNEEVYRYLMSFKSFMENKEYGLLTDDRPPNRPWD